MTEIWLHANRRALAWGMAPPAALALAGCALAAAGLYSGWGVVALAAGAVLCLAGLLGVATLAWWMSVPRLAREGGELLVFLERGAPARVPLDVVECFFLGQGDSTLPKQNGRETETKTVVVRLAERAREWAHRDVSPTFGHWCEGYITISGAWCEPITAERLQQLNQRLTLARREAAARETS